MLTFSVGGNELKWYNMEKYFLNDMDDLKVLS